MSANEIMEGFSWIAATIHADTTLMSQATGGVWRDLAPPGTVPPFIIMVHQSGSETTTVNAYRLLSKNLYQIKVVGPASETAQLVAASESIDRLFGGPTSGSTSKALIDSCYRQSGLAMSQIVAGEQWSDIGGMYMLEIQRTS